MGFKSGSRFLCSLGSNLNSYFLGVLHLLCAFGDPSCASSGLAEVPWVSKMCKNPCIFQCFLQMQVVSSLKLVMALLGSCWPSCDALISKWVPI